MDFELKGRHAVVTGGTRGIGRATVLALIEQGVAVTTCFTSDSAESESLPGAVADLGGQLHLVRTDVRDAEQVGALMDSAVGRFGPITALVNNAGVISHLPLEAMEPAEWHRILDTNVSGMYNTIRAALPHFTEQASVVNISSGVARHGMPFAAHYVTSKAAIFGLTRALCKELGPRGVRVNCLASGVIDNTGHKNPRGDEGKAMYVEMTSLRRLGEPAEIADVVCFLLSDASRYMTGAIFEVDGGI
ncbi:SDR family NAD(P)-dependent oxidoreductase [Paractinoplanes ferrugineus]|uniref:Short-chain dehydrogenase n=1 Tax=Paractinoplanes ferrugineus TaxID=113564 RepID=A0A919MIP6_9ACTN|nr:SDR family NAD(P)-dependent oxidoreductase [Actinoplanes ferrugineus]GIE16249.1 short-chain dehydrogenase [Actinoplanes ferrugineus]